MTEISSFYVDGVHTPLSNFYASPIIIRDLDYLTVEHYYQASKARNAEMHEWVRKSSTPGVSKRRGREVNIRPDWEMIKLGVMRKALEIKFAPDTELAEYLLNTGDAFLIEGNNWGDTFWGVCKGDGENWLGSLLMVQRAFLRSL